MLTSEMIADLGAKLGITSIPANMLPLIHAAYTQGALDALQRLAGASAQAPGGRPVTPRQQAQAADLALVAARHPEVDLDKPVFIRGTAYKIVGFKANAPKHAFLIEGPQGGRYKCPVEVVLWGQH